VTAVEGTGRGNPFASPWAEAIPAGAREFSIGERMRIHGPSGMGEVWVTGQLIDRAVVSDGRVGTPPPSGTPLADAVYAEDD
jgi:hypothetical protein